MDPGVVLLTLALASALALGGYGSWYGAGLYNCGAVRPLGPLEAAAAMMGWRPVCDACGHSKETK